MCQIPRGKLTDLTVVLHLQIVETSDLLGNLVRLLAASGQLDILTLVAVRVHKLEEAVVVQVNLRGQRGDHVSLP